MKLKNLKDAINHIAVKGLLKKRESKSKVLLVIRISPSTLF